MVSWPVQLGVRPPFEAHDQIFITVGHLRFSYCGAPSLTRGLVCNLLVQFNEILRSKFRRTHDHTLLSHLRLMDPYIALVCQDGFLSMLCSLGEDHIENTASHNFSLVACAYPLSKRID
jgi:hypothetical protein